MLVHQFANYVMQSKFSFSSFDLDSNLLTRFFLNFFVEILHTAVGNQREEVFNQTSVQLTNLRKYASSYSKHLIASKFFFSTFREKLFENLVLIFFLFWILSRKIINNRKSTYILNRNRANRQSINQSSFLVFLFS